MIKFKLLKASLCFILLNSFVYTANGAEGEKKSCISNTRLEAKEISFILHEGALILARRVNSGRTRTVEKLSGYKVSLGPTAHESHLSWVQKFYGALGFETADDFEAFFTKLGIIPGDKFTLGHGNFKQSWKDALVKLNTSYIEAVDSAKEILIKASVGEITKQAKLLTPRALTETLKSNVVEQTLQLSDLGIADPMAWQIGLSKQFDPKSRSKLLGVLTKLYPEWILDTKAIPIFDDSFYDAFANHFKLDSKAIKAWLQDVGNFKTPEHFHDSVAGKALADPESREHRIFLQALDHNQFSPSKQQELMEALSQRLILLAYTGEFQSVNNNLFQSMLTYARRFGIKPVITPFLGEINRMEVDELLAKSFNDGEILLNPYRRTVVNPLFDLVNIGMTSKVEPFSKPEAIIGKHPERTKIIPHNFGERLQVHPTGTGEKPIWASTGAITNPEFKSKYVAGAATDLEAHQKQADTMGFLVLDSRYKEPMNIGQWVKPVPRFVKYVQEVPGVIPEGVLDLGEIFQPNGKVFKFERPDAAHLTDVHQGATNPRFFPAVDEVFTVLGAPREIVMGDIKEGHSVSHWLAENTFAKAQIVAAGDDSWYQENFAMASLIRNIYTKYPSTRLTLTWGNHDAEWDTKLLQYFEYLHNQTRSSDLKHILEVTINYMNSGGRNPLLAILNYFGVDLSKVYIQTLNTVAATGSASGFRTTYELASDVFVVHGHQGPNGARGITNKKLRQSYGSVSAGHTHSPGTFGQAHRAGTGQKPNQSFHSNLSSTECAIDIQYFGEYRQLLFLVGNSFLPKSEAMGLSAFSKPQKFAGFPKFKGVPETKSGYTSDQLKTRAETR